MISIDYTLIIVVLNFVLLLIILNKILYKPIKKFLGERQSKIAQDIDEAEKAKEKAAVLVEEKQNELKQSSEEIRKLKKLAEREAETQADEIIKQAKEVKKKIELDTTAQLDYEKDKAKQELEAELADLISSLSGKIISEKMDAKSDDDLIKKILSERGDK